MVATIRRFDVVLAALDPTVGSEIRKTRPCVVVSPDTMNRHLRTVVVAPMTTAVRNYPSRVAIRFRGRDGEVALDQIKAVDKSRLIRRLGAVDRATAEAIARKAVEMFALGQS